MKPISIPAALVLTLLSSVTVHAAENYAGVSVGRSDQKFNMPSYVDESDTAFKLYGGHKFNRHFGVEAGYVMHGESKSHLPGYQASTKASSLYLAGTATLPLTEKFAVTGKLGIADNHVQYNNPYSEKVTVSHTGVMGGIGASYAFTQTIAGVVELEHFRKPLKHGRGTNEITSLTMGVRKSF